MSYFHLNTGHPINDDGVSAQAVISVDGIDYVDVHVYLYVGGTGGPDNPIDAPTSETLLAKLTAALESDADISVISTLVK